MSWFYPQTPRDIAYNLLIDKLRKEAVRSLHKPHELDTQTALWAKYSRRIGRLAARYYRECNSKAEEARRAQDRQDRYNRTGRWAKFA